MTLPTLTDLPIAEIAARLTAAVERSPADETSITWIEDRAQSAGSGDQGGGAAVALTGRRISVETRVRERGRVGLHRTGALDAGGLDAAVRLALGQARLCPSGPPLPMPGPSASGSGGLNDPAISDLDPATARDLLAAGREASETLRLDWHELRLAVANSRGLARSVTATSATLDARCGDGPGAGRAVGSARSLAALVAPLVVERARARRAGNGESVNSAPPTGGPFLLSPEAVASLVRLFAASALSSRTVLDRVSFLTDRFGQRVFAPAFHLFDDGGDADGLPFPCDTDGWPKRRVALVEAGNVDSPAIDPELGRALGRTPTPHAVAADESRPGNLFVPAGEADEAALLAAADGGWAVGALDDLVCHQPTRGRFRARACGVRRIEGGRLAGAAEDFAWEGGFEQIFGDGLRAVGNERVVLACDGAWGGVVAPALVVG